MSTTIEQSVTLTVRTCPTCGIAYALPDWYYTSRKNDGESWYCPNGHCLSIHETTEAKLRAQLEEVKNTSNFWEKRSAENAEEVGVQKRKVAAQKAAKTKLRKRISNGVCPCCMRTFPNLARHMAAKHPEYRPKETT